MSANGSTSFARSTRKATPGPRAREALGSEAADFPDDLEKWKSTAIRISALLEVALADVAADDAPANAQHASTAADLGRHLHVVVDVIRLKVDQRGEVRRLLGEGG